MPIQLLLISLIFSSFVFEYISLASISKKKTNFNFKTVLVILIIALLNYVSSFDSILILKSIISILTFLLICKILLSENFYESISCAFCYLLIVIVLEFVISIILTKVLSYDGVNYVKSVSILKAIVTYIMMVCVLLISQFNYINKLYLKMNKLFRNMKLNINIIYMLFLMICVLCIFYIVNIVDSLNILYSILYILIMLFVIIYIIYMLYEYHYAKLLNSFLEKNNDNYQKVIDEYKLFKHNVKHKLSALSSIGNARVKNMVNNYLNELSSSIDNSCNISSVPSGLKGVIYQKLIENEELECQINVDNFIKNDPLKVLSIKNYCKLVESFGILFDNAIEELCGENSYIYVYLDETNSKYIVKVCNKIDKKIDVSNLFEKGITTKNGHNGLGLYYINTKTEFNIKIRINNNMFETILIVNK